MGKLRANASKEVADLAKEVVKKWKTEVEKAKGGAKGAAGKAPCAYSFPPHHFRSLMRLPIMVSAQAIYDPCPSYPSQRQSI